MDSCLRPPFHSTESLLSFLLIWSDRPEDEVFAAGLFSETSAVIGVSPGWYRLNSPLPKDPFFLSETPVVCFVLAMIFPALLSCHVRVDALSLFLGIAIRLPPSPFFSHTSFWYQQEWRL